MTNESTNNPVKNAVYQPRPIDTSAVSLPPELTALAEELAESVHEHWSAHRLAAGWKYGPERSDTKKEHPNLVPYDALSEADKEYDRVSALETLRAILALGFHISAPKSSEIDNKEVLFGVKRV